MEVEREDLAIRLIEERTRTGFSQADFARKLDITREGLRLYESGQRGISAEFLARTAMLGTDVQYILTGVRSSNLQEVAPLKQPQGLGLESLTNPDALKPFTEPGRQLKEMTRPKLPDALRPASTAKSNVMTLVDGDISGETVTVSGNTLTMINTPKHVTRTVAEVKPGVEHITEEQAARLMALVKLIVEWEAKVKKKPNGHRGVWAALNAHCRVTKYRLIALGDYAKAENYLHQWLGRLQSMASAPVADNDTWRKRRYAYIKINTRENEAWLLAYLRKNFKAESLTDLADDALERTYRAVAARKRRN